MSKRVIIINFDVESMSYQAFTEVKQMQMKKQIKCEQMAIVSQKDDTTHSFEIKDFIDFTGNNKNATTSLIGMLIGTLAGPMGILLGWFAGSMVGSMQDAKELTVANSVFDHVENKIPAGKTGIILIADEDDNRPLNQLVMYDLEGEITRLDFDDVYTEVQEANRIEKQTREHATDAWNKRNQNKDNQTPESNKQD